MPVLRPIAALSWPLSVTDCRTPVLASCTLNAGLYSPPQAYAVSSCLRSAFEAAQKGFRPGGGGCKCAPCTESCLEKQAAVMVKFPNSVKKSTCAHEARGRLVMHCSPAAYLAPHLDGDCQMHPWRQTQWLRRLQVSIPPPSSGAAAPIPTMPHITIPPTVRQLPHTVNQLLTVFVQFVCLFWSRNAPAAQSCLPRDWSAQRGERCDRISTCAAFCR